MKKITTAYVFLFLIFCVCSSVRAGLEHDLLLTASLNHESDINPDLNFPEFSSDESDARFCLDAEYTFTSRTNEKDSAGFVVGGQTNMYMEEDQFNYDGLDVAAFYRRENMGPFTFYVNFRYNHYGVDGDPYLYTATLTPVLFWEQSSTMIGSFSFRMCSLGYYNIDALDGMDFGFEYKQIWFVDDKSELAVSLFINDVSLDADEMSYFGLRAGAEYTLLIQKGWEVHGVLYLGNKAFAEDYPGEGEARNENYINGVISSNYSFGKYGSVFAGVSFFNNTSNVETFETDRMVVSAGYIYKLEF